jgi:hypothetical protein
MLPEITLEWLEARVRADDDGCWIWTGYTTKHGQPQARLNYQLILVRRVVWEMKHDKELKSTMWVAAKCNKPGCCHPDCMVARTRSQALKGRGMTLLHRAAIATAKRRNSDIPDEVVAEVRASDEQARQMARRLGLTESYVSLVRRGKIRVDLRNPFTGLGA